MAADDFLVHISDSKGLGFCPGGQRQFFAEHGLDFVRYVREGILAGDLLATDDANARRLVEAARARHEKGESA